MGVDYKKWIGIGLRVIPYIGQAIQVVEGIKGAKGGAEKKAAVLAAVRTYVEAGEFVADRDLLEDSKVAEATGNVIDAIVSLQNAIAAAKAAKLGVVPPK
jgi:hypothetical protein